MEFNPFLSRRMQCFEVIKRSSPTNFLLLLCFILSPIIAEGQQQVKELLLESEAIASHEASEEQVDRLHQISDILADSAVYDPLVDIYKLSLRQARKVNYPAGENRALLKLANEYSLTGAYINAAEYSDSLLAKTDVPDSMRKVGLYIKGVALSVTGDYSRAIDALKQSITIPVELDEEMELYDYLSYSYSGTGLYEKAINTCFEALELLRERYPTAYRHHSQFYHNLGLIHLQNNEFEQALKYYRRALRYNERYENEGQPEKTIQNIGAFARSKRVPILLETGTVYKNLNDPDSAIIFYRKARSLALKTGPRNKEIRLAAIGIALAHVFNGIEDHEQAWVELGQIEEYFVGGKLAGYTEYVSYLIAKGETFNGLKQYEKAKNTLHSALSKAHELSVEDVNTIGNLYQSLSTVYESLGDHKNALVYFKFLKTHQDSLFNADKTRIIKDLETRYRTLEKENELFEIRTSREKLRNQLTIAVLATVFFITLAVLLFLSYRRKQRDNRLLERKNEEINKKHKELESSQHEVTRLMQQEIEHKQRELATLAIIANEKDQFLSGFKKDITGFVSNEGKSLLKQIDVQLSSENSWNKFLKHFELVHPDFFTKLRSDFSQLTNHDLKLAAYIRIGMDNKEIAQMMNIDHNSAKNSVYRLKKKLNLRTDQSIHNYIIGY